MGSLLFLLHEQVVGLLNLQSEGFERGHVLSDLLNWELDQHTGDLWCLLWSDDHVNVVEDQMSNLILEVWVSLSDGVEELLGAHQVLLLRSQVLWDLLHSWSTWHSSHWCLWHTLSSSSWHSWLWSHWLSHWHLTWSWWHVVHTSHLVVHVSVLLVVVWSSLSTLVTSEHASLSLVHSHVHGLVLLDESKKLLNDLGEMRLAGKIVPLESTRLLGLILLEVRLILDLLDLLVSDLLDFVMVDDKDLSVMSLVVKGLLGGSCSIWLLEANKGI